MQKDVNHMMDFIEQQVKQSQNEILGKLAELANSISSSRNNEEEVTHIYVAQMFLLKYRRKNS